MPFLSQGSLEPRRRRDGLAMRLVTTALLVVALGLTACSDGRAHRSDGRPRVLATTGMIADAARRIGGERVDVEALMAPGVDPHLYRASAGDVRRLQAADLILYNGLFLEGKLGDILTKLAARRRVTAVAEAVPVGQRLASGIAGGHYDPHVWFDVRLWTLVCERVAEELSRLLPAHTDEFRKNFAAFQKELVELDAWVEREVATIPLSTRVLVTAHDAFGYFGRRYSIEVVGLQGLSTVSQAGLTDVQRVVELILDRKIKAIFVESSVPRRTIEAVQAACRDHGQDVVIGGELYSDSVGPEGSGAEQYAGMVRHNVNTVAQALR